MKKKFILLFTLIVLACGNNRENECRIMGKITNLTDSVVAFYGMYGIPDSVVYVPVSDGRFEYTLALDTIAPVFMYLAEAQCEVPLFTDKNTRIRIEGDREHLDDLRISGGKEQNEYSTLIDSLRGITDIEEQQSLVDSFVVKHPHSVVSIYLIDHYFVRSSTPDIVRIERLINSLSGSLRDHPYIVMLQNQLKGRTPDTREMYIPYISLPDTAGLMISTSQYKDKYVLLSLWASWHASSRALQDSLKSVVKDFAKRPVEFVNVSLDMNQEDWKSAILEDSLSGVHLCDSRGWLGRVADHVNTGELPANVLLDIHRRIVARNVWGDSLRHLLDKRVEELEVSQKNKKKKK